jgi:hypothetical protein
MTDRLLTVPLNSIIVLPFRNLYLPASPSSENEESDDQREEPHEGPSNEPLEPAKVLEINIEEPLAKRKPGWLK